MEFLEVKGHYESIPLTCITMDFYKNHYNKYEFAVYRLSWINPHKAELVSHNLGALACNRSHADRKNNKVSDLLIKFSENLRPEYVVSRSDAFTASENYGTDVRKACSRISRNFEWCFGHLAARSCVEAFGTSQAASQSKSTECRFFPSKIKKTVE